MKIAFTGSQGTGKTTLLNDIEQYFTDHQIISEVVREELKKDPFLKINEQSTSYTQNLFFNKYLDILLTTKDFISDRSLIDVISYTYWIASKGDATIFPILLKQEKEIKNNICLYDFIFYFPIEFSLIKDGVRSEDEKYRCQIDKIMQDFLHAYYPQFITISGTPKERREQILNILKRYPYER